MLRAAALLPLLVACSSNVSDNNTEALESAEQVVPTVSFGVWSVKSTSALTSGGKATLHYDASRLPKCRSTYRGYEAWSILANWQVDGGQVHTAPITTLVGNVNQVNDLTITVPVGKELSVWFWSNDYAGCREYDSDFGKNFHFALTQVPALRFNANWTTTTLGTPKAGSDLLVDFDLLRLSSCRALYNGYASWDVAVNYRIDSGEVKQLPLTATENYQKAQSPARLAIPTGAHHLEMWFDNWDRTGCHTWDSAYGANYHVNF